MNDGQASIIPILKQVPLFATLNEQDHQEIVKNVQMQLFPANYAVFTQGDAGDNMYIVKKGEVQVARTEADGSQKEVARIGEGNFFGEMALFSSEPRNATCTTTQETELFMLSRDTLFELIQANPDMATRINQEFLGRIKSNQQPTPNSEQQAESESNDPSGEPQEPTPPATQ